MVEEVESFGTKLEGHVLFERDVLEQSHVEVRAFRVPKEISRSCAEREADGSRESGGVKQEWAKTRNRNVRDTGVGVADQIGIRQSRCCSYGVRYASIITGHATCAPVCDAEGRSTLNRGDARPFP